ncbi:MAG: hypothetical protein ABFS18_02040 [Thermodesulfobacteriota bacterium]
MNGMCQTCGTVAPVEWFLNEPIRRQFEAVLIGLPKPVTEQAFFYLSLFRPASGRSLTPKKALRVLTELRDLVAKGYVTVRGRVDRSCPSLIWATAMETMVNQRHALNLPMPNHNYLVKVAYDLADAADRQQESSVRIAETNGQRPIKTTGQPQLETTNPLAQAIEEYDAKQR